ncbi:MAG: adenylyl-sulfate kinase [Chloroflexales bacterium]|nr:adenylyl-sulfate kinase [Chloroflexales bacterium]
MSCFIVFTGLPGAGKSRVAEALERALNIPVFAKDWLEAAIRRCEEVGFCTGSLVQDDTLQIRLADELDVVIVPHRSLIF